MLPEVGLEREVGVRCVRRQRSVLSEVVQRAVHVVRAALRDDVHESAARSSELGVRSLRDDDHLAHGVEIERERRPLATALLAEERIVEIGAIDRDVVVNAALSADAEHVAVGALSDRDVRSEEREVEIVAAVVRKRAHDFGGEVCRFRRERGIDRRDLGDDGDARELRRRPREDEREIDRLAERDGDVRLGRRRVADGARRHLVIAEWKQSGDEHTLIAGFDGARVVRLGITDGDECGDGITARVGGDAANDAGGRLRLRAKRDRSEGEGREEERESQRW